MAWLYWVVFVFALTFAYASWRAAPWLPMYRQDVERAADLAKLKVGEKFFDLGAGDGRMLFAAAARGAFAEGFEISLLPYLIAKLKIYFFRKDKKTKIFFRDLWMVDLKEADAVFVFLMPRIMPKLREKMERELKPGARVVCYSWPIPGWQPRAVDDAPGRPKIYLYER